MAGKDITAIKYVENMRLYDFLTALSYRIAEIKFENEQIENSIP